MKIRYIKIRHIVLVGMLASNFAVCAENAVKAESRIKSVVVYPNGAMVSRTAKVNLKAGTNSVKVPLLTPLLQQRSVQVGVQGGATLESVKYDVEVPNRDQITSGVQILTKRATLLRDSIEILKSKIAVLDREKELLRKSDNIGGKQGFTAQTLQGVTSYLRKDLNEIVSLQYAYQRLVDKYQKELTLNEQQVNLFYDKQIEPKSCLNLSLNAPAGGTCQLEIQYLVDDASWMPFYEARILKRDTNLHLIQKAFVSQGSKEKWTDVNVKLSQNDPNISNEKPELQRYSLPFYGSAGNHTTNDEGRQKYVKVLGIVSDAKTPLKGALVTCGDLKTETDANGYYELLVPVGEKVNYSYFGYYPTHTRSKNANVDVKNVRLGESDSKVQETRKSGAYSNYLVQNRLSVNNFSDLNYINSVSSSTSDVPQMVVRNVVSDVPGKYTVPDDGADHEVVVKDMALNADYNYYAVPKLSKDVYLVATVPNWKKLDLIDGSVKLFLNNIYMGESFINAQQTEDTLKLSVGKDKDLVVDRKDLKTYHSKNLTKTTNKVQRDWLITVKNNKTAPVKITVEDQFPVSTDSDIKVELLESSGAIVDEVEGKLTWKLNLKPGEKRELKLSYSVKSKRSISVE